MIITIQGIPPSKKNSKKIITRGHRQYIVSSDSHQAWHKEQEYLLKVIKREHGIKEPLRKVESITLIFTPGDRRRQDLTNKAESVTDLLVDTGIISDDNWFVVPTVILQVTDIDKENPRVEIIIN